MNFWRKFSLFELRFPVRPLFSAFFTGLLLIAPVRGGQEDVCAPLVAAIREREARRDEVKAAIDRNNQYLSGNPESSPSVQIKIKSNLLVANLQVETLTNEISSLKDQLRLKGCSR